MPEKTTDPTAVPRGRARLALALLVVGLFAMVLADRPLIDPDEGRYAQVAQTMLQSGDFVTPHLNGVVFFDKPPLYYWATAGAMAVFGETDHASRVWNALIGLAGVLLVYALARSAAGERAGLLAALVLSTSILFFGASSVDTLDPTVSFFIAGTLVAFWFAHRLRESRASWLWMGVFACSGLAVMAKGLIGIVIPGAVIGLYLLTTRQLRVLARVPWARGILVFAAITVPWFVLVSLRNPDFPWYFFVHEHLLRYTTNDADRSAPLLFLPIVLGVGLLPWTGAAVASLGMVRTRGKGNTRETALLASFLWIWALVVVGFFSLSRSQLVPYVLPAVYAVACLAALVLDRALGAATGSLRRVTGAAIALGAAAAAAIAWGLCWALDHGVPHWVIAGQLRAGHLLLASTSAAFALAAGLLWLRGRRRLGVAATAGVAVTVCVLLVQTLTVAARSTSSREVAAFLRGCDAPRGSVYIFGSYARSLSFYLGSDIGVVEADSDDLLHGMSRLSAAQRRERFPNMEEFRARWGSGRRAYLVVDRASLDHLRADLIDVGREAYSDHRFLVLVNR